MAKIESGGGFEPRLDAAKGYGPVIKQKLERLSQGASSAWAKLAKFLGIKKEPNISSPSTVRHSLRSSDIIKGNFKTSETIDVSAILQSVKSDKNAPVPQQNQPNMPFSGLKAGQHRKPPVPEYGSDHVVSDSNQKDIDDLQEIIDEMDEVDPVPIDLHKERRAAITEAGKGAKALAEIDDIIQEIEDELEVANLPPLPELPQETEELDDLPPLPEPEDDTDEIDDLPPLPDPKDSEEVDQEDMAAVDQLLKDFGGDTKKVDDLSDAFDEMFETTQRQSDITKHLESLSNQVEEKLGVKIDLAEKRQKAQDGGLAMWDVENFDTFTAALENDLKSGQAEKHIEILDYINKL